jgi:methionine synthase I (cobalamin-dependent)
LADVGPIAKLDLMPAMRQRDATRQWVGSLVHVDAILLETWSTRQALDIPWTCREAVPELHHVPFLLSLAIEYEPSKGNAQPGALPFRTRDGTSLEFFAKAAKASGFAALGVNCGREISMADMTDIIRGFRNVIDLPLLARPNAGTPARLDDKWIYPQTPAMMAERLPELLEAGVSMVGGCCGTTPEHIAAFKPIVDRFNARRQVHGPAALPPGPAHSL